MIDRGDTMTRKTMVGRTGAGVLFVALALAALLLAGCLPSADETLGDKPAGKTDWPVVLASPSTSVFAQFSGSTVTVTVQAEGGKTALTYAEAGLFDDAGFLVSGTNFTSLTNTSGTEWSGSFTVDSTPGSGLYYVYVYLENSAGFSSQYYYDPSISGSAMTLYIEDSGTAVSDTASTFDLVRFGILGETYNFNTGAIPAQFTGSGDASWASTTTSPYEGTYALQSGAIGDSQTSCITFTPSTSVIHGIVFSSRVSSEADYDFLRYYADGSLVNQWSGDVAWTQWHHAVSTGSHTFTWCYEKDGTLAAGSDAAWLDLVAVY